jgi:hypothetical protein
MNYIFFASVFITLFVLAGAFFLYSFIELMRKNFLTWTCYQHVLVWAIIAVICLIAAIFFGAQIPECYGC